MRARWSNASSGPFKYLGMSLAIEGNAEHLVFKLLKLNPIELAEGIRSYDGNANI